MSESGKTVATKKPLDNISRNRQKSAARLAACQIIYERGFTGDPINQSIADYLQHQSGKEIEGDLYIAPDAHLLATIVRGVGDRQENIDDMIDGALESPWSSDRLEVLLRAILRAGVYEILAHDDLDVALIIKEYVGLADAFYDGAEPKLVNAVLDRVGRRLRPAKA
jgi:N utilization substance protein B